MFNLKYGLTHLYNTGSTKKFCSKAVQNKIKGACDVNIKKAFGQPAPHSHPHLLGDDEVTPLIKKQEYQCRRQKLVDAVIKHAKKNCSHAENHMIIIPSTSKKYMSDKIPYVFRQNTDFLYLTGCQEPDTCAVITAGSHGSNHRVALFTRDKDDHAELWDGPRTHPEDAPGFFGVDQGLPMSDLSKYISSCKKALPHLSLWYDFEAAPHQDIHKIVCDYLHDSSNKTFDSPRNFIHKLRLYKSTAEVALMQRSCDIASKAFIETMSYSRPGIGENQLFAKVDYECRVRGAEILAYPPVVAGGTRATTIHYINNNQLVFNNEMVLVDAGCEYHGYSSDITRTWPINGRFTNQQREIYEIVLDVQKELIDLCAKRPSLDALFECMCLLLGKRLQELGLIGIQPNNNYLMQAAYQLCPHHVSHYLGMDVHDTPTISRNIKLEPGMIVTVEPGIYITEKSGLPKEYHGIGIRIEDDVLITVNGPVVLSRKCPKDICEVEQIASVGLEQCSKNV
ncbi:xaa-Pro aminopeptidase 3-like isoform X2 [Anthonomus grandis grandis]|uniref:xaa-Pro aminopeptidase 3-like isoform X2 n=1 Tax=Anthonomus grandis grandis TaxID=2921223 RepID=UPI00216608A9|nr:xaa-Pro aminopeptidase 3-like isoform X2 [Anthonomus grandis grandis]